MNAFAHVKPDCPFFALFEFGRVPIKSVLAVEAECIGDGVQAVFMVDLERLSAEQIESVWRRCDPSTPLEQAVAEMRERGLPLRAKYVEAVSMDAREFL